MGFTYVWMGKMQLAFDISLRSFTVDWQVHLICSRFSRLHEPASKWFCISIDLYEERSSPLANKSLSTLTTRVPEGICHTINRAAEISAYSFMPYPNLSPTQVWMQHTCGETQPFHAIEKGTPYIWSLDNPQRYISKQWNLMDLFLQILVAWLSLHLITESLSLNKHVIKENLSSQFAHILGSKMQEIVKPLIEHRSQTTSICRRESQQLSPSCPLSTALF